MKKISILFFVSMMLIACASNEPELTECQKENVGYLKFNNTSSNAYDIFIDGTHYKQQPGNSISSSWVKFKAGKAYVIKVQQVSGYIFSPTVKNFNVTINQCDEKTITFP